ncbi:hypothetical protein AB0J82_08595 [Asanoa sp. NPDC049518]|uniref:hypothetical protein n=1 Tax=unclassified Asanoa TaxID=2685164 RepID=UPI0034484B2C
MRPVSENEALAYAGRGAVVVHSVSVSYAIGPAATVVVVDAGDRPDGSGVTSADGVHLRGPFPPAAAERLGAHRQELPIHGFARMPDGCLPLGPLRVAVVSSRPTGAGHFAVRVTEDGLEVPSSPDWLVECSLRIDDPLPYDVLDRVRPVPRRRPLT